MSKWQSTGMLLSEYIMKEVNWSKVFHTMTVIPLVGLILCFFGILLYISLQATSIIPFLIIIGMILWVTLMATALLLAIKQENARRSTRRR